MTKKSCKSRITCSEIPTTVEDLALKRLDTFDEGTVKNVTEMSDTFTMTDVMGLLPGTDFY